MREERAFSTELLGWWGGGWGGAEGSERETALCKREEDAGEIKGR